MTIRFKLLFVFFIILSCVPTEREMTGVYVMNNISNTVDTLVINSNRTYLRKLYNRRTNKLIYVNEGKWKLRNYEVNLTNYFIDRDIDYINNYFVDKKGSVNASFGLIMENHTWQIYTGLNGKESYYKKICHSP